MNCPKCGAAAAVLETRDAPHGTTKRRQQCELGHRFNTYEIHEVVYRGLRARLVNNARVISDRIARLNKDVTIAKQLHLGWQQLAELYGLKKQTIYQSAARGRAHLKLLKGKQ